MASGADIVNQSLALGDNQAFVTGVFPNFTDGTPENVVGQAANKLYAIARDVLLSQVNPEFARVTAAATEPASLVTPIVPWTYEYTYPADGIRLRQIRPPSSGAGSLSDPNDPLPIRGAVAYDPTADIATKVVLTNQQNALLVYTANSIAESLWDSDFVDAMSRRLGNPLTMALAGRPDFARELLAEAQQMASLAVENTEL